MSLLSMTKFFTIVYSVLTLMALNAEIASAKEPESSVQSAQSLGNLFRPDRCENVLRSLANAETKYNEACAKIGASVGEDGDGCTDLINTCQEGADSLVGGVMGSLSSMMVPAGGMAPGLGSSSNKACSTYTHKEWKDEKKDLQDRMNDSQKDIIKAQKDAADNKKDVNQKINDSMKDFNALKKELDMADIKLKEGIRGLKNETLKLIHEVKEKNDELQKQIADLQAQKAQVSADFAVETDKIVEVCVQRNEEAKAKLTEAKAKPGSITAGDAGGLWGKNNNLQALLKKEFKKCISKAEKQIAAVRKAAEGKLRRIEANIAAAFHALARNEEKIKQYESNLNEAKQGLEQTTEVEKKNAIAAIQALLSNVENLNNSLNEMNQNTQMEIQLAQQKMMGTQMELSNLMSNQPKPGATMTFSDAQGAKANVEAHTRQAERMGCMKENDSGTKAGGATSENKKRDN